MPVPVTFVVLFVVALAFGFLDGFHNSANVVATVISSRAMRARQILLIAAAAEFVGPFLLGTAIAQTIGKDLVNADQVTITVAIAAASAAITWKLLTWWPGIPASSSHSLFGGLIGAVAVGSGIRELQSEGLVRIVAALLVSPLLGMVGGHLFMLLTLFLMRGATPKINSFFKRAQLVTSIGLALGHGSNNSQKVMGLLALGLVSAGMADGFSTPLWVIASAAGAMALGTAIGGHKMIHTVGYRFYKIRPLHGFTAQTTSGMIILGAALMGGPVSTTQVVSSTIIGVGSAERLSKVRWKVFSDIGLAWIVTIPATALIAAAIYFPFSVLLDVFA